MTVAIDWENLGFAYMKLPYRYIAHYKNGQWDQGELTEDATLHISATYLRPPLDATSSDRNVCRSL